MLHELIAIWFSWVRDWGYFGVFILMALESTIVPVPSEIVMPPAAYWAAQGQMNFWGVVASGALGSLFGSSLSYLAFRFLGLKWVQSRKSKIEVVSRWVEKYGAFGVFVARLLPVVRHLISMPAGLFKMPFQKFALVTFLGSGLWCFILAEWGKRVIGAYPQLINSPEEMMKVLRAELSSFVFAVVGFGVLYILVQIFIMKKNKTI